MGDLTHSLNQTSDHMEIVGSMTSAGDSQLHSQWPFVGLDLDELRRHSWAPVPFTQFIVKVHSRCNLDCSYCYVYNAQDHGWRTQPTVMSAETMAFIGQRIAEHVERFGLPQVSVVFHGGEPLLVGGEALDGFAASLTSELGRRTQLRLGLQTNGILLNEEILRILGRWNIKVGVSLDGARVSHDRRRQYRNGAGSYDAVANGIKLLSAGPNRHLFSGLLCVADVETDPVGCYLELTAFEPPAIDFLLPHANWGYPPMRSSSSRETPYAEWLIAIFDAWYQGPRQVTSVRLFEEIMGLLLGASVRSESVGLSASTLAIVEVNGDIEQVDSLKSAYDGASRLGLNIREHSLETALWHPMTVARQLGLEALCQTCRSCSLRRICGGGHFAHRYRPGGGFLNPSVYGPDIAKLIAHIGRLIYSDLQITATAPRLTREIIHADGVKGCVGWMPNH